MKKYTITIPPSVIDYITYTDSRGRYFNEKLFYFIGDILEFSYSYYDASEIGFYRQLSTDEINMLNENGIYLTEVEMVSIDELIKKLTDSKEYTAIKIVIDEFCS